jgi:replication factor C large subunit
MQNSLDLMLCEKYAPYTLNAVAGNSQAIARLSQFAINIQRGIAEKPLLLYGPPGTGKTAAAHALAYSNGFELIELNASDYRNREKLEKMLLPASTSMGIFKAKFLILLDEIDELSSKFDAGAESAITELLQISKHPIIFIANDYWDRKIAFLRGKVEPVQFKRLSPSEVFAVLKKIAEKEKANVSDEVLNELANRSNGDLRGAINDLEFVMAGEPILIENLGIRDREMEIFGVLDKIFLSRSLDQAKKAINSSDTETDMLINWVDENIPNRYKSKESISKAYYYVSRSSFFEEKAGRTSYYGYLRYSKELLAGVALANDGNVSLIKNYAFPARVKFMSLTKKEREAKTIIAQKLIYTLHSHKRYIMSEYFPMLRIMIERGLKEYGEEKVFDFFESEYRLSHEEVNAIKESKF